MLLKDFVLQWILLHTVVHATLSSDLQDSEFPEVGFTYVSACVDILLKLSSPSFHNGRYLETFRQMPYEKLEYL